MKPWPRFPEKMIKLRKEKGLLRRDVLVDLTTISVTQTHHCLLHIDLLPPGQAKISNLGSQILSHQDVPGSQVSMNKLEEKQQRETLAVGKLRCSLGSDTNEPRLQSFHAP